MYALCVLYNYLLHCGSGIISCCTESSVILSCDGGAGRTKSLIIVSVVSLKEKGTSVVLDFIVSKILLSANVI